VGAHPFDAEVRSEEEAETNPVMRALGPIRLSGVLGSALLLACLDGGSDAPDVSTIEPSVVSSLVATPATITGTNLFDSAQTSLDDDEPPRIVDTWTVTIGEVMLDDASVRHVDSTSVDITVPEGLDPGLYTVTVVDPAGTQLVVGERLEVTDDPVGFEVSIEDAPGGAGAPIGMRALSSADTLPVFAVVRAPNGEFDPTDIEVTWTLSDAIGTIAGGPSTSAVFQGTSEGTTLVQAAHPHNMPAETDTISVTCDQSSGWTYRRQLTFDNAGSATSLDDFVVLIVVDSTRIDYAEFRPAGQDLRFFDAGGSPLFHQTARWDTSGTSYVWVRVPRIDAASTADHIWMHYGNPSAADAQSPEEVWDVGYEAVWHLDGSDLTDSTRNDYDATRFGATNVDGVIAGGKAFDAASMQYLDTSFDAQLATYTIEAWVRGNAVPIEDLSVGVVHREANFQINWNHLEVDFRGGAGVRTNGDWFGAPFGALSGLTWYWLTVTYDGDVLRAYRDGALAAENAGPTGDPDSPMPASLAATIGKHANLDLFFDGSVDEVRFSSVARSPDWIAVQHASMTDRLVTFGPQVCIPL
jgi:hypothetical protein